MRPSLNFCLGATCALLLLAMAPPAATAAESRISVTIKPNGYLDIVNSSGTSLQLSTLNNNNVNLACSKIRSTETGNGSNEFYAKIYIDRPIKYYEFMMAANLLQDCKIYNIVILGWLGDGKLSRRIVIPLDQRPPTTSSIQAPPIIQDPGQESRIILEPPRMTVVSIEKEGEIQVWSTMGYSATSSLPNLRSDVLKADKTSESALPKIFLRADAPVPFDSLLAVLDQLNRDGFHDLHLINEDVSPIQ